MIGRMISPDPIVPDALNAQTWNRYSYVGNDPLTLTDPTGHFFKAIGNFFNRVFHGIKTFLQRNPIVRAIVQVAATAIASITCGPCAIAVAAASAAVVTGLSGGNLGQMLRAGAIAGATAFAFYGVGEITGHTPSFGTPAHAANIAGHAGVGCVSAAASGGNCGEGALSGAVGAAAGPLVAQIDGGNVFAGAALRGAVGGLAAVAGGGKFENGAVTAAFGYLFNEMGDYWANQRPPETANQSPDPIADFVAGFIPGYDLARATNNPDATGWDYAIGAAGLTPGAGKLLGLGGKAVGGVIRGYTKHGIEQAILRQGHGVHPRAILDAVKNPVSVTPRSGNITQYKGHDAIVRLNRDGNVVTVIPRGSRAYRQP